MGLLLGIVANVLGGTTYVLMKLALAGYPPVTLTAVRLAIGIPLLWLSTPRGWRERATRADGVRLLLIGSVGLALPLLIGVIGLAESDAISAAILIGLEPVSIVVLARLFLGEELRAGQGAGVVFALLGAAVVISRGDLDAMLRFEGSTRGAVLLALQGCLWAVYTVLAKPTLVRVPAPVVAAASSSIAFALVAPASAIEWGTLDWDRVSEPGPLSAMLALALFGTYLGTVLWNRALSQITATQMAVLVFIQPLVGTALGALIGEPLHPSLIPGALLVFGGVWLSRR